MDESKDRNVFLSFSFKQVLFLGAGAISFVLLLLVSFFHIYGGKEHYALFGPRDDFRILNVTIDTSEKYVALLVVLAIINMLLVFVNKVAIPAIKMTVSNPLVTEIYGIRRLELETLANYIMSIDTFIDLFSFMLLITKLDILIFCGLMKVISIIVMNRFLLSNKIFYP